MHRTCTYLWPFLAIAFAHGAEASVIRRNIEIDLANLSYSVQQDGPRAGVIAQGIAPVTLLSSNDVLVTRVSFARGEAVQLINVSDPAQPGKEVERIQYQYLSSFLDGTATRGSHTIRVRGVRGDYDLTNPTTFDAGPTGAVCGNCIQGFTLGDLTDSAFSFRGLTITTRFNLVTPGDPFSTFGLQLFAGDIRILPRARSVPEPATLGLMALALAGIGFACRGTRHG